MWHSTEFWDASGTYYDCYYVLPAESKPTKLLLKDLQTVAVVQTVQLHCLAGRTVDSFSTEPCRQIQ